MRILTSKYWEEKFKKTVIDKNGHKKFTRDGKMFEDLVKEILDLEYGFNQWKRTGESWDGSRDFEWHTANTYKWAECKNYEDKISLNVLSNTLVMALVDFADEILIFSYSKIKQTVLNKIIQYADISQKKVRIYADESLEEIILLHFDKLKDHFFPSANFAKNDLECLAPYVSCHIIADPVIAYTMNTDLGAISKSPSEINFDTVLCMNFFLYNRSSRRISVEIKIEWDFDNFIILNKKTNIKKIILSPNSIDVKKVYFRMQKYRPVFRLPNVKVICGSFEKIFSFKTVKCSGIGDCSLQGFSYKRLSELFETKVIRGNFFRAFNLYGTSGVGKSRLLKECENIALGYGFRIIRFRENLQGGKFGDIRKIIAELICGIYDIPDFDNLLDNSSEKELSEIYRILYHIKYDTDSFDCYIKKTVLPIVIQKLKKTRCYISIDNVQYYPPSFITFLQLAIEGLLTENGACECRIGVSFNMDYISQQEECMSLWDFLYTNTNYIISEEIVGFIADDEAKMFINYLLQNHDIEPDQIQMIVQSSKGNPFYVKSYLRLLETENIIIMQEDKYVIPPTKLGLFREKMKCIPKDISSILESRWEYFLKNFDEKHSLQVLGVLHIFQKISNDLIEKFGLSDKIVTALCDFHFLIRQNGEEQIYAYEHDLTETFFCKKYFPLCKHAFEAKDYPQEIDFEWYKFLKKIADESKKYNLADFDIIEKTPPYKIGYEVYTLWMSRAIQQTLSVELLEYNLKYMKKVCEIAREIYGTDAAIILYKKIINLVKNKFDGYQANINWAWIMISYCNLLYERNLYYDAIQELNYLLRYWAEENITSQNIIIYAYIYNRLHVYHRALHTYVTSEVINWLEKAEELQDCLDSPVEMLDEIRFINLIDRGYCNYKDACSKREILTAWQQACEIYEKGRIISKKVNYLYAKIQILLFQNNLIRARETIKVGLNAIETKEQGTYYFLYFKQRYLLCQIICILLGNQYQKQEIEELFSQIEDYNYVLKSRISYSIQWLKSIFYFYQEKYIDAFLCLQSSYSLLFENKKRTFQNIFLEQIYNNFRYFLSKGIVNRKITTVTIQLTEQKLVLILRELSQLSISKLKQIIINCQATSILQDRDHKINFPTL